MDKAIVITVKSGSDEVEFHFIDPITGEELEFIYLGFMNQPYDRNMWGDESYYPVNQFNQKYNTDLSYSDWENMEEDDVIRTVLECMNREKLGYVHQLCDQY